MGNNSPTFKTWLGQFKGVDSPIGDLAYDVLRDKSFPDTNSYDVILDHISAKSRGDRMVIRAFKDAWGAYSSAK